MSSPRRDVLWPALPAGSCGSSVRRRRQHHKQRARSRGNHPACLRSPGTGSGLGRRRCNMADARAGKPSAGPWTASASGRRMSSSANTCAIPAGSKTSSRHRTDEAAAISTVSGLGEIRSGASPRFRRPSARFPPPFQPAANTNHASLRSGAVGRDDVRWHADGGRRGPGRGGSLLRPGRAGGARNGSQRIQAPSHPARRSRTVRAGGRLPVRLHPTQADVPNAHGMQEVSGSSPA